jgi:hypothetical protein
MFLYAVVWLAVTALLGWEYWALAVHPQFSFLHSLQAHGYLRETLKLTTDPGSTVSLWVGWIGIGLMIIMNGYSIRKRLRSATSLGRLSKWLDFHIFCGILGPTLILFHCQLKVRGVVGISFWSMVISFSSGIIGRYFFVQIASQKHEWEQQATKWVDRFDRILAKVNIEIGVETKLQLMRNALALAGGGDGKDHLNPISALAQTLAGDIRLLFSPPQVPAEWPAQTRDCVLQYALCKRRSQFLASFQKLMGYWHAFHFPFAIFMYIAAVIHVVSSLIFLRS